MNKNLAVYFFPAIYTTFALQKVNAASPPEPPISSGTSEPTNESISQQTTQSTASLSSDRSKERTHENRKRTHGDDLEEQEAPVEKVPKEND